MKRTLVIAALVALLVPTAAMAQTASGTLTVTATVQSSINLVFNNGAGLALSSGAGTNAATLAFGNVSAYGAIAAGITRTVAASDFTVSAPVNVFVSISNSASAAYTMRAQLGAADAVNTWQFGGFAITNAAPVQITAAGGYGANVSETVALTIPFATASGTAISNTIAVTATAN